MTKPNEAPSVSDEQRSSFCGKCGHPLPVIETLLAEIAQLKAGCTRSHPHELMTPMCELRTDIARLTNHLAVCQAELSAAKDKMAMLVDALTLASAYPATDYDAETIHKALAATSSEVAKHRASCDAAMAVEVEEYLSLWLVQNAHYPNRDLPEMMLQALRSRANELRASANPITTPAVSDKEYKHE